MVPVDKIVDKIRKLLALATSSNEHESRLAAEKAQELLVKYNLSMQSVNDARHEYTSVDRKKKFRLSTEDCYVLPVVSAHFFVRSVIHRDFDGVRVELLGTATNVEIASYVYEFLVGAYKRAFVEYQKAHNCDRRDRQIFYQGLQDGLHEQLRNARKGVETSMGLVVVPDAGLNAFVAAKYPVLRSRRGYNPSGDANAYAQGRVEGQRMRVSRGLNEGASDSGRYLGGGK